MGVFDSLLNIFKSNSSNNSNSSAQNTVTKTVNIDIVLKEENDIAKQVKERKRLDDKCNVLIMPTSIFNNGTLSLSTYKCENNTGHYISQMEPVAKYLGKTIGLDQIILLTTNETVKDKKDTKSLGLESYPKKEVTAVEFLKDRLACVFGEKDSRKCNFVEIDTQDLNGEYTNEKTIYNLFSELEKNEGDVNVYMDIHGGFRDNQMVLTGIMSLLKNDERLHLKNVYSLYYSNNVGTIVDSTSKLDIFDFTSGMSEFVKYGSVSAFETFNKNKNNTPAEKDFIDLLNNISDAISLCNMNAFDDALVKLNEKKDYFEAELKDTYYGMFLSRLLDQYKVKSNGVQYNLLDSAGKKWTFDKFVTQVEWCLNKGMTQQALTIIESKTAEVLENEKIIYSSKEYEKLIGNDKSKLNVRKKANNHNDETTTLEYFENWIYSNINGNSFTEQSIFNGSNMKHIGYSENGYEKPYGIYYNYVTENIKKKNLPYMFLDNGKASKTPIPFRISDKILDKDKEELLNTIYVFGSLIKKIKWVRNNVNHAANKNNLATKKVIGLCGTLVYSVKDVMNKIKA